MTEGFSIFMKEAEETGQAYNKMIMQLSQSSALDKKTHELAYISVLSAVKMTGGLEFHVKSAKKLGASRDEVKSAVLVGLPAVGVTVIEALKPALDAYDNKEEIE
ncbi:alkylhydroperoxidase/carboxymuconolactone decarboxylase family protein YurZ [Lachnotalea glycerini]|uniref:Carboxymuconolactone decarboxylase family protein n=1 Tax=Lachnotalea glycerini TaxID=1763509 RepID=A0A255IJ14_9FIRM|nr:carboxymuconolactone decarboxylase family protein [Lachnotalea glycerini]PXV89194.1 alkylhydroperoxidase/carboxymuconolactone decarboxylase family protein YurZ [Lachnotalea glycerini]RDY31459.1 carboxymuconolactone decarboxylase family protein [Lachnotalea glycerini]